MILIQLLNSLVWDTPNVFAALPFCFIRTTAVLDAQDSLQNVNAIFRWKNADDISKLSYFTDFLLFRKTLCNLFPNLTRCGSWNRVGRDALSNHKSLILSPV